jgi:large subunit ribosomal protein L28|uniref:Large ribosomal subunit protein bL28 n=1 Tax=Mesoaciditoga lauensis TaxID=1495039 RepID=A0A7V3RFJ0_9BACT
MSRKCDICGKDVETGHRISHSHRKTLRTFKPNLQPVKVKNEEGKIERLMVCTRCLKAGKVQRV